MNAKQIQYAVQLSQVRNFSQLAEQLHITQSALSKQILSLEKELGVKLFDRSCTPLALTPAGEVFVRDAQEILYREQQLLRAIEQYQSGSAGKLTIGITPFRSAYLIPPIVKAVRERFPGICICLREAGSEVLRKEAAEGKYDFAIVNLPVDDSLLDIQKLESDSLVLVVPKALAGLIEAPIEDGTVRFADCAALPFVVVGQAQEMRRLFDKMCTASGFFPNIAVEVVGLTTAWAVAREGTAATILPMQFASQAAKDPDLLLLRIQDAPDVRLPVIVTRRGQYLSAAARYAMELLAGKT